MSALACSSSGGSGSGGAVGPFSVPSSVNVTVSQCTKITVEGSSEKDTIIDLRVVEGGFLRLYSDQNCTQRIESLNWEKGETEKDVYLISDVVASSVLKVISETEQEKQSNVRVSNTSVPNFASIAMGSEHACGLTDLGAVYCWGYNVYGQLGVGGNADRYLPESIDMTGLAGVVFEKIDAGASHTCGLTTTGLVYCWGINQYGQLGINSTSTQYEPMLVEMPSMVTFHDLALGLYHSCALGNNHRVYCWGNNESMQIGDGTTTPRYVPTLVQNPTVATDVAKSLRAILTTVSSARRMRDTVGVAMTMVKWAFRLRWLLWGFLLHFPSSLEIILINCRWEMSIAAG
ncbi:MAG: hypothetical protein R3A11_07060 [Bdellovibrionota bacterium]